MIFLDNEYEEMACEAIKNYLNKDLKNEVILKKYKVAVYRLINKSKILIQREDETLGVKSLKEGDSSITYDEKVNPFVIDSEIMGLLPAPYVRMY